MDLFREKHTPQTEYGSSQKVRLVLGYEVVSFKRWVISWLKSRRGIPVI